LCKQGTTTRLKTGRDYDNLNRLKSINSTVNALTARTGWRH
jgi:hypothetical protein